MLRNQISLPCRLYTDIESDDTEIQLHVFCDELAVVYGA